MEKRSEPRFPINEAVTLTVYCEEKYSVPAYVRNISGRGLQIHTKRDLPCDAAVRLEWKDLLVLGEVCYCKRLEEGGYSVGLELVEALNGLGELAVLAKRLLGEEDPGERWNQEEEKADRYAPVERRRH